MLTITRKDLLLTINDNVIPAMGSSDVPVKFVNDAETYAGFLIEPRVGYYVNGCPKSCVCEYSTESNTFSIPAEAFKSKGILVVAIALVSNTDSNHIEVTKELALEVTPAPNGTVILPATDTWQTAVNNLVEQLYNQDYKPQFDEIEENLHNLVKEAQNQQSKANNQQTQIDNAIDVMGDYEIVQENPTQIRFKKGDGTYGDTVNLGDNLASKSMVNAGYDTYSGNSYSGSASDYGIEIAKASGNFEQEGTPTPESPIEPKFFELKNVYSAGKNLFNPQEQRKSRTDTSAQIDGNDINVTGLWYMDWKVKVEPNTDYTISFDCNGNYRQLVIFDKTGNYDFTKNLILQDNQILQGHNSKTFNTKDNELIYVLLYSGNGSQGTSTYSNVMINKGTTEQPYTPFVGQSTTPLNLTLRALPNGVCDTYENGVITRKVGYIEFDGSEDENWKFVTTETPQYNRFLSRLISSLVLKPIQPSEVPNMVCNRYNVNSSDAAYLRNECISISREGDVLVYNEEYSTKTIDEWKQLLQSNPIRLWYQLATPTTEQVDLPVIPSYFPYTNAWHDSEVEASDLTWNILARQYGSGQTTIKKDEAVLTELDLNTERTVSPTTVKVQLQDSEGKVLYLETSSENIYIQSGRFSGKTVQQVLENSIQAISATDEYIEVDVPNSMTQSIDEEFLVDEVDESETETE